MSNNRPRRSDHSQHSVLVQSSKCFLSIPLACSQVPNTFTPIPKILDNVIFPEQSSSPFRRCISTLIPLVAPYARAQGRSNYGRPDQRALRTREDAKDKDSDEEAPRKGEQAQTMQLNRIGNQQRPRNRAKVSFGGLITLRTGIFTPPT
jgi:hypothetical protein